MHENNLLSQVSAICKKYENIEELSGSNFNIFKILNVETKEVDTHSAFIAELLNPKGSHKRGGVFLDLFIKMLGDKVKNKDINAENTKVIREHYIGTTTAETGGRIDILIKRGSQQITIENKIYANEQDNQLLRYFNFDKKADLLYLTLDGADSTTTLKKGSEYQCISYKSDILNWLKDCKKEATDHPLLRETITQYENLIKHLTNQTINKAMANDLIKIILEDNKDFLSAFFKLNEVQDAVYTALIEKFNKQMVEVAKNRGLTYVPNGLLVQEFGGFTFYGENGSLGKQNLCIHFRFHSKKGERLVFGFLHAKPNEEIENPSIIEKFREKFGESQFEEGWLCWKNHDEYNWNAETYLKINSGELAKKIEMDIAEMLKCLTD